MMYPDVFALMLADPTVTSKLGSAPLKFYPGGMAPQGVNAPYAVWQVFSGYPENYINQKPDIDSISIQIDVYSSTLQEAREITTAIVDVVESNAHVTNWRGEQQEKETLLYRVSFDSDWFVNR